jgi:hypothetical protein
LSVRVVIYGGCFNSNTTSVLVTSKSVPGLHNILAQVVVTCN